MTKMKLLGFDLSTSDVHQWTSFTLVLFLIGLTGLIFISGLLMTIARICNRLRNEGKTYKLLQQDCEKDIDVSITSFIRFLSRDREYDIVYINKAAGKRIGIRLEGGIDNPSITGDPGVFIKKVKPRSPADGRLFPGDKILSVNDVDLKRASLCYALKTIRDAKGLVKICVKRAQYRERRIKEALSEYSRHGETVFTHQQIEEFEDGFSVYDRAGTGMIKRSAVLPLLRSLGYNLLEAKIWIYMNKLGFTVNPNIKLQDFVKLMHLIVTEQHSYENDFIQAYSVYQDYDGDILTAQKLKQSMKRMPGRIKVTDSDLKEILRVANGNKEGKIYLDDFKKLVLPTMRMY